MYLWECFLTVVIAGAVGGFVNAFLSNNGFVVPQKVVEGTSTILKPGVFGNVLVGSVASLISWFMYGPVANTSIRSLNQVEEIKPFIIGFSILIGIGGARWLSSEVDKQLLRVAGQRLAKHIENPQLARAAEDLLKSAPPGECVDGLRSIGI
jgi:hypothetical protein